LPQGCNPATIEVDDSVVGVCGYVEHMWLKSTIENANGDPIPPTNLNIGIHWFIIPDATEATFDPGIINQNTYFVRCSRNFSCCDFGESNVVSIIVDNNASCNTNNGSSVISDCDDNILLISPTDDMGIGDNLTYVTDSTIYAGNKVLSGANIKFHAKTGIEFTTGFEVFSNSSLEAVNTGCNDNE